MVLTIVALLLALDDAVSNEESFPT